MSLDLASLARDDTARIEFTHPVTGAATGCFITLHGPGSEPHEEAAERLRRRRMALIKRYKREDDVPNEATYASFCEFLADVTEKIEGLQKNGQPVEYTRKVAYDLFVNKRQLGPELAAQAAQALGDITNFSQG
jgi:hypothetical protein